MGIANLKSAERAINAKNSFKALALIKTFKALSALKEKMLRAQKL